MTNSLQLLLLQPKPQKTVLKYGIKRRVDDVTKSCHKSYTYILALPKPSLAGGTSLRQRRQRRTVVGGSI